MANIRFRYLYRDASNYKKWGAVIFLNDGALPVAAITESLASQLWADGLFIASQVNIPEVFLFDEYPLNIDDHCFHEFDSVEVTEDAPNDRFGRSISEFLEEVEQEAQDGWEAFDPLEPFAHEFRLAFKGMFPG